MTARWAEPADGVFVRRYAELDLSVGLIVGDGECLVIDTRGDAVQGAELAGAIRAITPHPWQVVYTHGHFDHIFGTSAFQPCPVWAHRRCLGWLAAHARTHQQEWVRRYRSEGRIEPANALNDAPLVPPQRLVDDRAELTVGGRRVVLIHPGPGHTDHDLVVHVPDAGVLFAGDLVEHGAPPQFEDACPLAWPSTVDNVLALRADTVVPGHGDPVGPGFLAAQHDELRQVADLCQAVAEGELAEDTALARSPYPADVMRTALQRVLTAGST